MSGNKYQSRSKAAATSGSKSDSEEIARLKKWVGGLAILTALVGSGGGFGVYRWLNGEKQLAAAQAREKKLGTEKSKYDIQRERLKEREDALTKQFEGSADPQKDELIKSLEDIRQERNALDSEFDKTMDQVYKAPDPLAPENEFIPPKETIL